MQTHGETVTTAAAEPSARTAGASGQRPVRAWPLLLLAAPAGVAIWSGWVGLGGKAGFGVVHPLPGIWDELTINTAITLPIGMEAYAAYALHAWLSPGTPPRARTFAKRSAIGALVLGAFGQMAFHLMVAAGVDAAPWIITALVACLPVGVLGMGAALAHLLRDDPTQADVAPVRDQLQPETPPIIASDHASPLIAARQAAPVPAFNTNPAPWPACAERLRETSSPSTTGRTDGNDNKPAPVRAAAAAPAPRSGPTAADDRTDEGAHRTPPRRLATPEPRLTARERELLPRAQKLYDEHQATTGKPLSRNALRRELGIGADPAGRLLAAARDNTAQAPDESAA